MDGITGIDRDRAKNDIMKFDADAAHALVVCHDTLDSFFSVLANRWASTNAKTFTEGVEKEEENIFNSYWNELERIISGAYEAANILLRSLGEVPLNEERNFQDYMFILFPFHLFTCKEEINGKVGMDTESVRTALATLKTKYNSAIDCIDDLPTGISFYDPDGELVDTYNSGLKSFKQKFKDVFDEVIKKMDEYITTETENIELAKEQAQDSLSN